VNGVSGAWPTAVGVSTAVACLVLLTLALRHLPVGTAYAVWVGIGASGVALAGTVLLGEQLTTFRLTFLALIVVGVVGLRLVES